MNRFPDWEARLAAYLEPLREVPFEWGKNDCCTLCAGAIEAMTGVDPMPEFRGHYRSKRGSVIALGRRGRRTLAATLDAKFEAVAPGMAHRGDIVMVDGGLGIAMGTVSMHVGREGERHGLILQPRAAWQQAWRVPMPGGAL